MARLSDAEYKRMKELDKKKDLSDSEKEELASLKAKRANNTRGSDGKYCFKPGNDFSWWSKVPVLLKDAVNLPLNWIPGTPLIPGSYTESGNPSAPVAALRLVVQNVYGTEDSASGPLNLAARNLYLAMHRKYRGLNAYQASDIAIVIAATIELFILIARIERIYGVINYYSIENRTLPYALLGAMGVSTSLADNIRDNLSDFRYAINNLIRRAQNVCIPKDLSVLLNKIALFGYVYKDHDSVKGQAIVFDAQETGIYVGDLTDTGGGIAFIDTTFDTDYTVIIDKLRTAVSALVEDSDVLRIYSDFLSYLDPSQFMTLIPVPEEYTVVPVYSEEILHKVHNLYSLDCMCTVDDEGSTWTHDSGTVYVREMVPNGLTFKTGYTYADGIRKIVQKDNVVNTKLCVYSEDSGGSWTNFTAGMFKDFCAFQFDTEEVLPAFDISGSKQLFDTYRHEADPATMLEGSLFKFVPGVSARVRYIKTCAWEIIVSMQAHTVINGKSAGTTNIYQFLYTSGYDTNMNKSAMVNIYKSYLRSVALLEQFDWAPIIYTVIDDDLASIYFDHEIAFAGDVDNCRLVGYEDIYRMHEVAVYSGLETSAAVVKE